MSSSDGPAIGVPGAHRKISKQHCRLTALLQRIERLIRQQRSHTAIVRLLDRLIVAAEAHFDYEAYVQNALGLGGVEYHEGSQIRPHALIKLKDRYVADRPPCITEAIDTLNQWLHHHQRESIVQEIALRPEMLMVQESAGG